jgi:transcriptional regulator with XRE-family HTH domain
MSNPLKSYREEKGLSQQEVADKLGVSRPMVGFLENGERAFSARMAVLMEKKLSIPRSKVRPDYFEKVA